MSTHTHTIQSGWWAGTYLVTARPGQPSYWAKVGPNLHSGQILLNHGHRITITEADIAAGVDRVYDVRGIATHTHSVRITAAMFAVMLVVKNALIAELASNSQVELLKLIVALHVATEPGIDTESTAAP